MRTRQILLSLTVFLISVPSTVLNDVDPLHSPAPFLRDSTFNQVPSEGKLKG